MGLQQEIDEKRKDIYTNKYSISIGELLHLYHDGELDVHPEFQRFLRGMTSRKPISSSRSCSEFRSLQSSWLRGRTVFGTSSTASKGWGQSSSLLG